jgi:hypothetical protein
MGEVVRFLSRQQKENLMRRVLPIAILAVPFLVRYAAGENKGGCEKMEATSIACPEPATTVDCTKVGIAACPSTKGQAKWNGNWGKAPSSSMVYTTLGQNNEKGVCYLEYDCYVDTGDQQCHFKLETEVPHDKVVNVTKNCP